MLLPLTMLLRVGRSECGVVGNCPLVGGGVFWKVEYRTAGHRSWQTGRVRNVAIG